MVASGKKSVFSLRLAALDRKSAFIGVPQRLKTGSRLSLSVPGRKSVPIARLPLPAPAFAGVTFLRGDDNASLAMT